MSTATAPDLLSAPEAAEYLGLRVQTLNIWRVTGRYGLPYIKLGRLVRYRRSDLDAWLESRLVTADAAGD